ncbi:MULTISPECIES: hypothetical protein [Eisenbergiella]|uniref:XRE family transcriptional regulator n=1 Tax=Eisenbergiella porci TaxID=2652274 RepID=A0A6N7W8J8_9FIRM|nr:MULTISPECIES: hypothetical protein [Eisenbergiella]MDY2652132.1 hypothetical protein [Eisenbergiella porci]MSS90892.1 hypothetical protein [Eisenbergiella porci]
MPKTRLTPGMERRRVAQSIISKYMDLRGEDEEHVAQKMDVVKRTLQNKRKRPETFTLDELWCLCEALKISKEDRGLILWGKIDE